MKNFLLRNFLLSIAIFLAVCIDGILISEITNYKTTEIAVNDKAISIPESPPIPQKRKATTERETTQILVVPQPGVIVSPPAVFVEPPHFRRIVCFQRWEYRPHQPIRNFVRFLHNRRPLRRLVCQNSLYIQH